MTTCDLAARDCEPCKGGVAPHDPATAATMLTRLTDWTLSDDATAITRRFTFK